jgi:esterase/lipase superfamily enzyme
MSATDRNKELFLQLVRGLSSSGICHVHFMSHSMGVQTLLSAFGDKIDGSRSDVSQCFRLDHSFADGTLDKELMICKSVTMLNPDFPVEAFVDHAFLSIRRVCSHITVVGDRSDQALFYSAFINGICNYLGFEQPRILSKNEKKKDKSDQKREFRYQHRLGRDIELLYFPDSEQHLTDEEVVERQPASDERLLFKGVPPIILSSDEQPHEHLWLDVDVIDTTQLDTNIQDLRHSGFNVNPILLNDLEELIVTGRRAANRSTLLFREGNIYSYCHVPSFVTM